MYTFASCFVTIYLLLEWPPFDIFFFLLLAVMNMEAVWFVVQCTVSGKVCMLGKMKRMFMFMLMLMRCLCLCPA